MGLLGKVKSESGVAEALQAKYSAGGVMQLCGGCETANYPHKALRIFDGSLVHCV